jgi:hypothetical protein
MKIARRFSAGVMIRFKGKSVKRTTESYGSARFNSAVRFTDSMNDCRPDPTDKIGGLLSFVGFADFFSKAVCHCSYDYTLIVSWPAKTMTAWRLIYNFSIHQFDIHKTCSLELLKTFIWLSLAVFIVWSLWIRSFTLQRFLPNRTSRFADQS